MKTILSLQWALLLVSALMPAVPLPAQTGTAEGQAAGLVVHYGFRTASLRPPGAPASLQIVNRSGNQLTLQWAESTPAVNRTLAGYRVLRNGVVVTSVSAATTQTVVAIDPLDPWLEFFTVRAFDDVGNISAPSPEAAAPHGSEIDLTGIEIETKLVTASRTKLGIKGFSSEAVYMKSVATFSCDATLQHDGWYETLTENRRIERTLNAANGQWQMAVAGDYHYYRFLQVEGIVAADIRGTWELGSDGMTPELRSGGVVIARIGLPTEVNLHLVVESDTVTTGIEPTTKAVQTETLSLEMTDDALRTGVEADYETGAARFAGLPWNFQVAVSYGVVTTSPYGSGFYELARRAEFEEPDTIRLTGGQYRLKVAGNGRVTLRWAEVTTPANGDDLIVIPREELIDTQVNGGYSQTHTLLPPAVGGRTDVVILASQISVLTPSQFATAASARRLYSAGAVFTGEAAELSISFGPAYNRRSSFGAVIRQTGTAGVIRLVAIDPAVQEQQGTEVAIAQGIDVPSGTDLAAVGNYPGIVGWGGWKLVALGLAPGTAVIELEMTSAYDLQPNVQRIEVTVYPKVEIAVDANRDGMIRFASEDNSDATTADRPHRFWVNDDDDVDTTNPDNAENAPVQTPNWTYDKINGIRDLEDFARLKIYVGGLQDAIIQGQIQIGLKWKDPTASPSLKVWRNLSPNGGAEYLTDVTVSQQHLALRNPGFVQGTTPYIIPAQFWQDVGLSASQPYGNLLFEGCTAGKGQLVITLHKTDGTVIGEGPGVWIHFKNIKSMYARAKATADGSDNLPFPYNYVGTAAVPNPTMSWAADTNGYAFEPTPDEKSTYIVFVHGWNQTYERSTMYAETMFKRLWHRGYKGRFVSFRWPTFVGNTTYNDSEYRAWNCGVSLKQYLDTLPSSFTIDLVAHSMGNIVAGSALEKGATVANYALLNAAVPAICYDTSGTVVQTSWGYITPNDDPDPQTVALSYQGCLTNVHGNLVNFYLPNDSALKLWQINNATLRPHQWPEGNTDNAGYRYVRTAAAGQKLLVVRDAAPVTGTRILDSVAESRAFAVQSPSLTVGADGRTGGPLNLSQSTDMTSYGFGNVHSAEFLFPIQQTRNFYDRLLFELNVPFQP